MTLSSSRCPACASARGCRECEYTGAATAYRWVQSQQCMEIAVEQARTALDLSQELLDAALDGQMPSTEALAATAATVRTAGELLDECERDSETGEYALAAHGRGYLRPPGNAVEPEPHDGDI